MLDHRQNKITLVDKNSNIAYFFVELEDEKGKKYGFQWIVEKVTSEGKFKNCWMTTSVSAPLILSKTI